MNGNLAPIKKQRADGSPVPGLQAAKKDAIPSSRSKSKSPPAPIVKSWHENQQFVYNNLEAHSDMVCCVDLDHDYIISGR